MGEDEKYISGPQSQLRQPNTWEFQHTREAEHESRHEMSAKTDSQKPFSHLQNQIKFPNAFPMPVMQPGNLIKPQSAYVTSEEATPSLNNFKRQEQSNLFQRLFGLLKPQQNMMPLTQMKQMKQDQNNLQNTLPKGPHIFKPLATDVSTQPLS